MILNKSEAVQVEWLIKQIQEVDQMIDMHRSGGSDFMANQYASRRLQYFKELIILLTNSKFNASGQETFPLVQRLIRENYPSKKSRINKHRDHNSFDYIRSFYDKVSVKMLSSKGVDKKSLASIKKDSAAKFAKAK